MTIGDCFGGVGGTAEGASLVLGGGQFIPGFEEQCAGQKVGETFDVNVTFPEEYPSQDLAGKAAVFTCTVSEIRAKSVPEIGPELAEKAGEPDFDTLKEKVKQGIQDQANESSLGQTREALREKVGAQYDFDVPASLVESSLSERRSRAVNTAVRDGKNADEAGKEFDEQEGVLDEVKSSMRAMFVLDEIARAEEIEHNKFVKVMYKSDTGGEPAL